MRTLLGVLAVVLAMAIPVPADPGAPTTYTWVVDGIVAALGLLPGTAVLDGQEVPTARALALLEANAAPLPPGETLYGPPFDDEGLGSRSGPPCVVAGILTAMTTNGPAPFAAARPAPGLPGSLACSAVTLAYSYGPGGAAVAAAADARVCLNTALVVGGWVDSTAPCRGGVAEVNMLGRVGFLHAAFHHGGSTVQVSQMFCGVGGAGPGHGDTCLAGVNR